MHLRLEEVERLHPGLLTAVLKGAAEEQPSFSPSCIAALIKRL